jgi:hypothetical protein
MSIGQKLRVLNSLKTTSPTTGELVALREVARNNEVTPKQIREWKELEKQGKFSDVLKNKKTRHGGARSCTDAYESALLDYVRARRTVKHKLLVTDLVCCHIF